MSEKIQFTRREFLKAVGMATGTSAVSLALKRLGCRENSAYADVNAEVVSEKHERDQNEEYEKAITRIERQLDLFEQQNTELTDAEIQERLLKHPFLEKEKIVIEALPVEKPWKPFDTRDVLEEALTTAKAAGAILLHPSALTIIKVPFEEIGYFGGLAFYRPDLRAVFLDQKLSIEKRYRLEKAIYQRIVSEEFKNKQNLINQSNLTKEGKTQRLRELEEWTSLASEKSVPLREIPKETIIELADILEQTAIEYRTIEAQKFVTSKASFDHEVFHYFFDTKFNKAGYEGPSPAETLFAALKNTQERFGNDSVFGVTPWLYIPENLRTGEGFKIRTDEDLQRFCEDMAGAVDLSRPPEFLANETWEKLTDKERKLHQTHSGLSSFLNEYLARVFNGALGWRKDTVDAEFRAEEQKIIGSGSKQFPSRGKSIVSGESFFELTDEEIDLIKRMQWEGKSIIRE